MFSNRLQNLYGHRFIFIKSYNYTTKFKVFISKEPYYFLTLSVYLANFLIMFIKFVFFDRFLTALTPDVLRLTTIHNTGINKLTYFYTSKFVLT